MVINIIGAQHQPPKLLQQIVLFVAGTVRTDDPDRSRTAVGQGLLEVRGDEFERLLPGRGNKLALALDERLLDACLVVGEVECVASLNAQEIAVDSTLVAIVATHNLHAGVGAADAERGLAAVATVRTDGADVLHLPRPRLVAISA